MSKNRLWLICVCITLLCQTSLLAGKTHNVVDGYGADNSGATFATVNIQIAIDACRAGDTLLIPGGRYLMNDGLVLKSDSLTVIISSNHGRVYNVVVRNFTINSCYSPIYFAMQNRGPGPGSKMDNIVVENINCLKSVLQPIIFNWQCGMENKMEDITLRNITVYNYGMTAGDSLTCMDGSYPDANKNGEANAYGIWARGVNGLTLGNCEFFDAGGSKREKYVFDGSVQNLKITAIDKTR